MAAFLCGPSFRVPLGLAVLLRGEKNDNSICAQPGAAGRPLFLHTNRKGRDAMNYYQESPEKVLEELRTTESGLSHQEAGDRLAKYGPNKLAEGKKVTLLQRFIQQLCDPMIIILLVAAAVSGVTAAYSGESFTDVFIILIVVLINAVLGVYQESKAEKAIEALQEMTAATSKVLRDGKMSLLRSDVLVPGDIVILEAGDAVPADCRILESASIKAEEAALTGESVPVEKDVNAIVTDDEVPLGDRHCMLYMGSTVVYGRGRAVVCSTGMDTEMGKIADALAQAEEGETPLQRKLGQLSKILSVLVLGICVFIFLFSLLRAGDFHLDTIISTFMVAVSLAVAATDDRVLNRTVAQLCRKCSIPVNVADSREDSTFLFPAVVRRGRLSVGISTGGASPAAAAHVRRTLEGQLPESLGPILDWLEEQREAGKAALPPSQRRRWFSRLLSAALKEGRPLTSEETESLLRQFCEEVLP